MINPINYLIPDYSKLTIAHTYYKDADPSDSLMRFSEQVTLIDFLLIIC